MTNLCRMFTFFVDYIARCTFAGGLLMCSTPGVSDKAAYGWRMQ